MTPHMALFPYVAVALIEGGCARSALCDSLRSLFTFQIVAILRMIVFSTTFSKGCLGSHFEEERSKV
jgi:hypothetical protein